MRYIKHAVATLTLSVGLSAHAEETPDWAEGLTGDAKIHAERCLDDNMRSCFYLAFNYADHATETVPPLGLPANGEYARQLYEITCESNIDGNMLGSCGNLERLLRWGGAGARVDLQRARCVFSKACEGFPNGSWIPASCNMLGELYEYGEGVTPNPELAYRYYKKSCDGPHTWACANLASFNAKTYFRYTGQSDEDMPTPAQECQQPSS